MNMGNRTFILSWDIPIANLKGIVAVHNTMWLAEMMDSLCSEVSTRTDHEFVAIPYATPQVCPNRTTNYVTIDDVQHEDCVVQIQIVNTIGVPV